MQEVVGSTPTISTKYKKNPAEFGGVFFYPLVFCCGTSNQFVRASRLVCSHSFRLKVQKVLVGVLVHVVEKCLGLGA